MPKKFVGEPFNVLERFGYRKTLLLKKAILLVPAELFCRLRVPKSFEGELFKVSEKFEYGKNSCISKGYQYFLLKASSSHSAEVFVGEPFTVSKKFGYRKKILDKEEISLSSVETPLSQSVDQFRRGTLLCFKKHLASKVFMQRRGHLVLSTIFCFSGSKSFVRVPFCIPKFFRCGQKLMDKRWGLSRF